MDENKYSLLDFIFYGSIYNVPIALTTIDGLIVPQ